MRIYDVTYAHAREGENFINERVAVSGYVPEAIVKANKLPSIQKWKGRLRVESVTLVASTESR